MIQETLKCLFAAWLFLFLCEWGLAQTAEETKQGAVKIERPTNDTPQPDDEAKPSPKQVEIGDAAPELQGDKGMLVNTDTPVVISSDPQQLTLIIFQTVW